jgi:hypothetical protein
VFIDIDRHNDKLSNGSSDDNLSNSSSDEGLQRELQETEIAAAATVSQRAFVNSTRVIDSDQDEEMLEADDTVDAASTTAVSNLC